MILHARRDDRGGSDSQDPPTEAGTEIGSIRQGPSRAPARREPAAWPAFPLDRWLFCDFSDSIVALGTIRQRVSPKTYRKAAMGLMDFRTPVSARPLIGCRRPVQ